MDARLRLVRKVEGTWELRVSVDALEELGPQGLRDELSLRGYAPGDLGKPYKRPRTNIWIIPVLRSNGEE